MNGYDQEVYTPEKLVSGAIIPVKVSSVQLKAGESINIAQPVYYDPENKEFTINDSHVSSSTVNHELYALSAETIEVDPGELSTTSVSVYLTGEFYKSAVSLVLHNSEEIEDISVSARKLGIFLDLGDDE